MGFTFYDLVTDIEVVKEIIRLVIFIIISIIGSASYVIVNKLDKQEKKQYINFLRNDATLDKVFQKMEETSRLKISSLYFFDVGLIIGFIYYFSASNLILTFLSYVSKSNMHFKSIILFNMDPSVGINAYSIYGTYIGMSLLFMLTIIYCFYWVKDTNPGFKDADNLSSDSLVTYHSYSFFIGVIVSTIAYAYTFLYLVFEMYVPAPYAEIPDNFLPMLVVFTIFFVVCIISILELLKGAINFLKDINDKIVELYKKDFPFVYIKTTSGKTQGYIVDIFNKYLIVLRDEGIQKSISWNCIEFIEMDSLNNSNNTEMDYIL